MAKKTGEYRARIVLYLSRASAIGSVAAASALLPEIYGETRARNGNTHAYIYGWDAGLVNGILNALSTIFSMINRRGCGSSFLFFSLLPPSCPFVLRLFAPRASVIRRRGGSLRVVNHGSVRLLNLHVDRE